MWSRVGPFHYFVTIRDEKYISFGEGKEENLSAPMAAMCPSNKRGQEWNANDSIIHRETIDFGLRT